MTEVSHLPAAAAAVVGALCLFAAPVIAGAVLGLLALGVAVTAFTTAGALWQFA